LNALLAVAELRAGKYKVPVGLEWLQRDPWTFIFGTGFADTPQRDVVSGVRDYLRGCELRCGVFNGVVDGAIGDLDRLRLEGWPARIFIQPLSDGYPVR